MEDSNFKIKEWWFKLNNQIINKMNDILKGKNETKIKQDVFFQNYRNEFGKLSQKQVDALNKFINLTNKNFDYLSLAQWAYVFATTYHETNKTFEPVIEAYWLNEEWRKKNLRYYPYYGRGHVQLTWKDNYKKYSDLIGVDMVENPELALDFENSFFVLTHGSKYGTFTGEKLSDYISDLKADYVGARRIINGTDKASQIALYAVKFEKIIKESIK